MKWGEGMHRSSRDCVDKKGRERGMKNVWKGLVLGGLTGVAAGVFLDMLDRGAREASALGDRVAHQTPEVVARLREAVTEAVTEGASKLRDPEFGEHVREISAGTKKQAAEGKSKANAAVAHAKDAAGSMRS
jgi:hypothetical protein